MIAHLSGVPVEELVPLALAGGTGLAAVARAWVREALKREDRPRGAA